MAFLSQQEQEKLKEQGMWVKEKCDACGGPILELSYKGKDHKVRCPTCARGKNLVMANLKEEMKNNMAKAEKKKNAAEKPESKKVAGVLVAGTVLAELYTLLEDQKKHPMKEVEKVCAKFKKDAKGRLGNLKRVGLKKGTWGLIVDEEFVQMKLGKMSKTELVEATPKKEKEEPKAKEKVEAKKKEDAPAEKEEVTSKQQQSIQRLVRKELKGKKDWRKNALIEHIAKTYDLLAKRVSEALGAEIKSGGVTEEKGVLALA